MVYSWYLEEFTDHQADSNVPEQLHNFQIYNTIGTPDLGVYSFVIG